MPITSAVTHGSLANAASASTTVAASTTTTSLVLVLIVFENGATAGTDGATPLTNSGTGMTWTTLATTPGPDINKCRTALYGAYGNQNASVTYTHTKANATAIYRKMSVVVIEGAHTTFANALPSGNRIATNAATANVSQSITPAGSGSAIFGVAGDWNAADAYAALTNNTVTKSHNGAAMTCAYIVPTTNPLSSSSAFTWGANCTGGANNWAVCEVVPAPGGAATSRPIFHRPLRFVRGFR